MRFAGCECGEGKTRRSRIWWVTICSYDSLLYCMTVVKVLKCPISEDFIFHRKMTVLSALLLSGVELISAFAPVCSGQTGSRGRWLACVDPSLYLSIRLSIKPSIHRESHRAAEPVGRFVPSGRPTDRPSVRPSIHSSIYPLAIGIPSGAFSSVPQLRRLPGLGRSRTT